MTTPFDTPTQPLAVLDTNVILDALVFGNPTVTLLVQALKAHQLVAIGTPRMVKELADVLIYKMSKRTHLDHQDLLSQWQALMQERTAPEPLGPGTRPICTDATDQMFIDLAVSARAQFLITRDRALLKTAKRCAKLGFTVCTPEGWLGLHVHLKAGRID